MKKAWLAPLLSLLLISCTSTVRVEAERAIAAGERVRKLSIEDQRAALGALQSLACDDRDVCHVRDACLRVALPTLAALEHRRDALAFMEVGNAADASAETVEASKARAGALLDAAHAALEQGKSAVPECDGALAVLERSVKGK